MEVRSINGKEYPLVSVVILNYNGELFLKRCVNSVLNSRYPNLEVIFVDNASTDGSVKLTRNFFDHDERLQIVESNVNGGCAMGYNLGAVKANGKYVVFLHNDTKVSPDWLKELVNVMESNSTVGVAQSKLLIMDSNKIFSAGGHFDHFGLCYKRGFGEEDQGRYDKLDEVFFAQSPTMAVRSSALKEVGYFDPLFFYHEDVDL